MEKRTVKIKYKKKLAEIIDVMEVESLTLRAVIFLFFFFCDRHYYFKLNGNGWDTDWNVGISFLKPLAFFFSLLQFCFKLLCCNLYYLRLGFDLLNIWLKEIGYGNCVRAYALRQCILMKISSLINLFIKIADKTHTPTKKHENGEFLTV